MKSIVVTGTTRGLGRAIHEQLVVSCCPDDQKIFISRRVTERVSEDGRLCYLDRDLGDPAMDVTGVAIDARATAIVFVSNAAVVGTIRQALRADPKDLMHALQVHCVAPLRLAQHLACVAQERGIPLHILNVSSGAASRPVPGWMDYCVSKAAAVMALDVLDSENDHVKVLHFNPGVMDTEMQATIRAADARDMPDVEQYRQLKTEGGLKAPEAVAAEVCAWLAQMA